MKKVITFFLVIIFSIAAFVWLEKDGMLSVISHETAATAAYEYEDIEVTELAERMASDDDFILLDVRTLSEYEADHIKGSVLIPLNQLADRMGELPKEKEIILYCRSGRRSMLAGELLAQNGFEHVKNLKGGLRVWRAQQPASEPEPVPEAAVPVPTPESATEVVPVAPVVPAAPVTPAPVELPKAQEAK